MQPRKPLPATVSGIGEVLVPYEFAELVRATPSVAVMEATRAPSSVLAALRKRMVLALVGPWRYLDAALRYVQHAARRDAQALADERAAAGIEGRFARSRARQAALRDAFARAMVVIRGERIWRVTDHPDIHGLTDWIDPHDPPLSHSPFLLPLRRLQRILTDMRRAAEGLYVRALDARLAILPHVYVPHDQSVVDLLADGLGSVEGARVLDMGTGTGVLAFVAARAGAHVVATDCSQQAVANARLNADRLGLADRVRVPEPADLFDGLEGELFDVIVFNAPWVCGRPKTSYDAAIYDEDFRVITGFMTTAARHLTPDGRVLLLYSSHSQLTGHGGLTLVRRLAARSGLRIVSDRYVARMGRLLGARERVYLFEMRRP